MKNLEAYILAKLATDPDLKIRQAVADQYNAPQLDAGSLQAVVKSHYPELDVNEFIRGNPLD